MVLKDQVETFLEPLLEEGKYFVVDIQVKPARGAQRVLILLDSDEGITVEECASVSRRLARELEESEAIDGAYTLEVSSPGLDQPLRLLRQYRKNVGRDLRVILTNGEVLKGKLVEVRQESFVVEPAVPKKKNARTASEKVPLAEVPLDSVAKALVQVSFN